MVLKNKEIVWVSLILGLLANSFAIAEKKSLNKESAKPQVNEEAKEKYIRKELISFTWGSGKYQLGSNWKKYLDENLNYIGPEDAGSHRIGPDKIIINKKGDIYIGDWLNKRTLIYESKTNKLRKIDGEVIYSAPMCFDEAGNLYLASGHSIFKFNSQLKFIEEYVYDPIKPSKFFKQKSMNIGKDGNFYIMGNVYDEIISINFKHKKIKKKINGKEFEFIPATILSKKQLKEISEKEVKIVFPKTLQEKTITLELKNRYGWIRQIIGEDKKGNIFLLMGVAPSMGEIRGKGKYIVQIYSKESKFISEITLDQDDKLHFDQEYLLDIDEEGNLYHLWIKKEGAKLIKWEKLK